MGLMKRAYAYCQLAGHHIDGEVKFNPKVIGMTLHDAPRVPKKKGKTSRKDQLIGEELFQDSIEEDQR